VYVPHIPLSSERPVPRACVHLGTRPYVCTSYARSFGAEANLSRTRASVLPDLLQNSVARGDTERDGERLQTPKVEEIPDIPRRDDMRRGDGDGITKPLHCLFA